MSLLVSVAHNSINVGVNTGGNDNTVSIGTGAASGSIVQGTHAVAVGYMSGIGGGISSVSIGDSAAATSGQSVAIGYQASVSTSASGVAIGALAQVSAVDQAIVINATGVALPAPASHTFVVHPIGIRASSTGLLPLYYDMSTSEIVAVNVAASLTVTYQSNGATGTPPPPQTVQGGATIVLPSPTNLIAPAGTSFQNWNAKKNGSGTSYFPGASFVVSQNQFLYAYWA